MAPKTKALIEKIFLLLAGLTILCFLTNYLLFLAAYSFDIDIYFVTTGMAVFAIAFFVLVFYKKIKLLPKISVVAVIGILTLFVYYKYTLTPFSSVAYINENFSGSVFIAFNQSDAKKIPVINNLLTLSVPAEHNPYTGRTATKHNEFFFRTFYFIDSDETLSPEAIEEAEYKRIFEFKLDSITGPPNREPFYFIYFYVTTHKMTTEEYLNSEHKIEFTNFKDSVETILVTKINE